MNKSLTCLLLCAALTACESDYLGTAESQLVVEGWIENEGYPVVILSRSVPISEDYTPMDELDQYLLRWAKVTVSDGQNSVVLTGKYDSGYFPPYIYTTGRLKGRAGKSYTLTVEYRDVNGNLLPSSYSKDYLRGETETLGVADPAEYSVDGDPQGYVLNGVIDITMDADTTIVVTYVDTYDVKLVVNDDEDQWGDTWTFRIADSGDTNSITKVAANATQVDLKGTHESATGTLGYSRTLDYTFGTSAEQHIVTTGTFTIPLTLTGKLTSEGYVITINSIGA